MIHMVLAKGMANYIKKTALHTTYKCPPPQERSVRITGAWEVAGTLLSQGWDTCKGSSSQTQAAFSKPNKSHPCRPSHQANKHSHDCIPNRCPKENRRAVLHGGSTPTLTLKEVEEVLSACASVRGTGWEYMHWREADNHTHKMKLQHSPPSKATGKKSHIWRLTPWNFKCASHTHKNKTPWY